MNSWVCTHARALRRVETKDPVVCRHAPHAPGAATRARFFFVPTERVPYFLLSHVVEAKVVSKSGEERR